MITSCSGKHSILKKANGMRCGVYPLRWETDLVTPSHILDYFLYLEMA